MRFLLIILCFLPFSAHAQQRFGMPIDCEIGVDCLILNYVDHDETEGEGAYHDYQCGTLSYDTHNGTDFMLMNLEQLRSGVSVLAAAKGKVKKVVNHIPDRVYIGEHDWPAGDDPCGNGVVLEHDLGWESFYCHMRRDSITVKVDQLVEEGDVLGQVGMSGVTDFPHVHFSILQYGTFIDPFVGHSSAYACEPERRASMWHKELRDKLAYIDGGVVSLGFADRQPTWDEIRNGEFDEIQMASDAKTLVAWAVIYGAKAGDYLTLYLKNPRGEVIAEHAHAFKKPQSRAYFITGDDVNADTLKSGVYSAQVQVGEKRDDGSFTPRFSEEKTIEIP